MSKEFLRIIEFLKTEQINRIGIFTHHNADPDAVASAIALKDIISEFLPQLKIELYASSINNLTKKLLAYSNEVFNDKLTDNKLDAIFLCDTNNLIQVGEISLEEYLISKTPFYIIDHHSHHDFVDKAKVAIVRDASSTAEIIAGIMTELNFNLESKTATLLLCGIIFDSRRFRYITDSTFPLIQYLINRGGDYEQALTNLQNPMSVSEKMARLKGVTRAKIFKTKSSIVTISHISSYESSVARALIELGSDVAAVIAKVSDNEIRVSLRCTKAFSNNNSINLEDLANKITEKLGGSGGGHLTAAGINIVNSTQLPSKMEEMIELFYNLIQQEIKESI